MFDDHLRTLEPERADIVFMTLTRCDGFWLDPKAEGCGHVVRAHYLKNDKAHPTAAVCPICGERYVFAFYKLKADHEYQPTPEEEADIRSFWLAGQRIAEGKQEPGEAVPVSERVRIHCRGRACTAEGHAPAEAQIRRSGDA